MFPSSQRLIRFALILAAIAAGYIGAFLLRYDFQIPDSVYPLFRFGLVTFLLAKLAVFWAFRVHTSSLRLVGLFDLCRVTVANGAASLLAIGVFASLTWTGLPVSVYVIDSVLCMLAITGLHLSVRITREVLRPNGGLPDRTKTILIYGAGEAGLQLAKELRAHPRWGTVVVGFLDDDALKRSGTLIGLPILGTGRDAASIVAKYERRRTSISEIVIAMPSATSREMRTAIANCRASGIPFKTLPSVGELLDGKIVRQIREVAPEDLLGRAPVHTEEDRIGDNIAGKVVLVTGGCGSIGSEICRQAARFDPKTLVIFDQAESEMFMLAMSLRGWLPHLNLVTEIGDITSAARVDEIMAKYEVDVVFHAAAYKHVPLMEENVLEAVHNNIIGTYNVALSAHRYGVATFVLISSDKAVNPTSVMGLTKRVAELLVSAMPLEGDGPRSRFVSVRFGNVLGSSGSVVQIFRRQIAAGGPVTITHPHMRRYFMSISEAVHLVLQASTMGQGSEVFVLDMGEPVLIADLARNMIRLAGLVPDEDIEIRVIGLRPGEKLFEEIHLADEDHLPTRHPKIKRFTSRSLGRLYLSRWLEQLRVRLRRRDVDGVVEHMIALVPEYQGLRRVTRGAIPAVASENDSRITAQVVGNPAA
jgi:FlaA1/EpsC-like NDP-sugar epimerase